MNKPLLIFDGDCGFCRKWIVRWKRMTGDRVDYASSQEVGKNFPDIPPEAYQKAVQLIEPDGRRSSAAEAVFRALTYADSTGWLWAYEKLPGFAPVSEFFYSLIAGHRPTFSTWTRWLWGNPAAVSSYRQVRWIFLRTLALIYGIAFWSFGVQIKGLIGSQGILPAHDYLSQLTRYGTVRFWYVPTLAWLNSSDAFLVGLCVVGMAVSVLLLLNMAPRLSLFVLWFLYLSIVSVGGDFMNFQWDALLLETGFLAIFFAPSGLLPQFQGAPSPRPSIIFLLRWLLFRLMLQSALVKWLSGDPLWHHLTALTVHYQTQPLPNRLSWYVHHFPVWFHKLSCAGMFVIEGAFPFLIFTPRRSRLVAFWGFVGLQALIFLTGNYTYFNFLAIALCLLLLEDWNLRFWIPSWCDEPLTPTPLPKGRGPTPGLWPSPFREKVIAAGDRMRGLATGFVFCSVLYLTGMPFARILGIRLPGWIMAPAVWTSSLRSFNSYGLFAVMTPSRPEIILEGSNDGKTWLAYEFKYKPGDLARRPAQVAPFQPRLDWQMWFAALGDYRQNPWFINFCLRVLQGSKPALNLLKENPFPGHSPIYLRATVYDYRFTTSEERRQSGHWWAREVKGPFCPVLSLKQP